METYWIKRQILQNAQMKNNLIFPFLLKQKFIYVIGYCKVKEFNLK